MQSSMLLHPRLPPSPLPEYAIDQIRRVAELNQSTDFRIPDLAEDGWINEQEVTHEVAEIEDCAIAVDATYYLQQWLARGHEPLASALAGVNSLEEYIEGDLIEWNANRVTPFFVFDGQPIIGQDEVSVFRGRRANQKTDKAWDLYFGHGAEQAVQIFGSNPGAIALQAFYPLMQRVLKRHKLHFLVPPFTAAAQIAYFDMIDSDQVAGIMGSQELLLYPIKDSIIRSIDWENKTIRAISKKHIINALNISETLFIDAFLMTGTSFLPTFPALLDPNIIKSQPPLIRDAVNILRTADKSVTQACTSFNDIVKTQDPTWLNKYRKARMAVTHFIYIAENGEVRVHDYEQLTKDNFEYLGLQLPSELFHYVNTGLVGPRILSWITHSQLQVLPTLEGGASDVYRKLVSVDLVPVKENTLGLLIPRLNRGIVFRNITMKVWYDSNLSHTVWDRHDPKPYASQKASSWAVKESVVKEHFPHFDHGSIASEIAALKHVDFAKSTVANPKERSKEMDSSDLIVSTCIWRFLHLRGYTDDSHKLTSWGSALATAMSAFEPTVKENPEVPHLFESLLVAFELLRFGLLNCRNLQDDLGGYPMYGTKEERALLVLVSRCASVLKLRHQALGYTGALSRHLLAYHSLIAEVRSTDRDLIEAIVASMFMYAQANRRRNDCWDLSQRLPFIFDADVSMAVAVKTLLDDLPASATPEEKAAKKEGFLDTYVPYATHFWQDFGICCALFHAIHAGVKALGPKELSTSDRTMWDKAAQYLEARR